MNNNTLTDEQRRAFADLIKEVQKKYEQDFNNHLLGLKAEVAPRLESRSKISQLMDDIRNFRSKLSEAADSLRRFGFRVIDDGMISVDYDVERDAQRLYEQKARQAREDHEQASTGFRKAIFDVWSAETAEEAREIVRRLVE